MTAILLVASQSLMLWTLPTLHSPNPRPPAPAYRRGVDGKLALSIPKAVLNDCEVARVSVSSGDPQNGGTDRHILKDGFLMPSGQGEKVGAREP